MHNFVNILFLFLLCSQIRKKIIKILQPKDKREQIIFLGKLFNYETSGVCDELVLQLPDLAPNVMWLFIYKYVIIY